MGSQPHISIHSLIVRILPGFCHALYAKLYATKAGEESQNKAMSAFKANKITQRVIITFFKTGRRMGVRGKGMVIFTMCSLQTSEGGCQYRVPISSINTI